MFNLIIKSIISGILIALASTVAKRFPGFGALIASLPLVSVLGMIWLWNARPDPVNMAAHSTATFWYVLPSLPMFLFIPFLLRHGYGFGLSLFAGCFLTVVLYICVTMFASRMGIQL